MTGTFVPVPLTIRTPSMTGSPLQIVPSQVCLQCDVCCRFPEPDSVLRPFFTADERRAAMAAGVSSEYFPQEQGGPVALAPHPTGEGYLCPAFDPQTSHCRIYDVRPLDCRLYPFAMMWDAAHQGVVLGWDSKCPFMREAVPSEIASAADAVAQWIERDETLRTLEAHPRLIGPFQDDVIVLQPLPRLTARLGARGAAGQPQVLTIQDRARFERAARLTVESITVPLAAFSFGYHYIWRHVLTYAWQELEGRMCLFARSPDGWFLALPPLGSGPVERPLAAAFRWMKQQNHGSSATRVENVPEELLGAIRALGYRVVPKESDYVYCAADLVGLTGDAYKSQRAACNRFLREQGGRFEPYRTDDREECLALYDEWSDQKAYAETDTWSRMLREDSRAAHEEALSDHAALGLTGGLVRMGGRIRAYTLGGWLKPTVFYVLLEVADRTLPGLAPFVFREFCRQAVQGGALWINTMDDSGLPSLAKSKRLYHPTRLLPNFVVTEP